MKHCILLVAALILTFSNVYAQEQVEKGNKKENKTDGTEKVDAPAAPTNKIEFKNKFPAAIVTITDEGNNAGSILLPDVGSPLSGNKLYNNGTILYWGNTALGSGGASALNDLSDAKYDGSSLFVGEGAGINDDGTSNQNTAVGYRALFSNTSGSANTANGYRALLSNTTGLYNTANGFQSLFLNTTGYQNTANGPLSLYNNTTGFDNTANGAFTLFSNTTGLYNTANGYGALYFNEMGGYNTSNGYQALYYNTNGYYNTATGALSLNANTTGYFNTANGHQSLISNTTGYQNTANGNFALYNNTTGSGNTANGIFALYNNVTGGLNTSIGNFAGPSSGSTNLENTTALGNGATVTASNTISLGNTSVSSIKGQVAFSTFSDGRYKRNVQENVKGLDFIMGLRPITYNVDVNALAEKLGENMSIDKDGNRIKIQPSAEVITSRNVKASQRQTGFIAQEVEALAKKLGYEFSGVDAPQNEQSMYGLRYAEFVVPLVKAVQEQQELITKQGEMIAELRKEVNELKSAK